MLFKSAFDVAYFYIPQCLLFAIVSVEGLETAVITLRRPLVVLTDLHEESLLKDV